jgi:error-prone DNA polymerase
VPGTPPYVELHCHSAYSFGHGSSLPDELIAAAAEHGYQTLALTDHDSLSGAMEFAMAARDSPVRAILGSEITLTPQSGEPARHLTLLVRDSRGWRHLCRLLTLAHEHTRDSTDRRAGQSSVALDAVLEHAEGLVCLSGCADHGVEDETTCRRLLEAFGADGFRVELQRTYAREDKARNRARERLARRLGVPAVATGGVHAHTQIRALLQDALLAVKNGMTLDESEVKRRANHSHVLARPQAMAARFADYPDAVTETVRLADTLRFRLTGDLGYRYPGADSTEAIRELAQVCRAEFDGRYPPGHPLLGEATGRLEEELRIIDSLGLAGFFLLHHELLELAREVAVQVRGAGGAASPRALLPPGRGRGSSVSSIVCYLTGLSHIDPVANKLLLGRFLHEDITGLPDIDIDFPRDIRAELIPRVVEHWGQDRAALVATFPTYRARGAIRDLGKALGLPPGEIERLANGSEGWGGEGTVSEDIKTTLGADRLADGSRWAWLARLADEAYGLPRYLGQHPGGMVLSTRPLIDCCPVVPASMERRQMVAWDKDSCSDAGFLKIDLLGLGMLSAVERCVELIASHRHEQVDLSRIPFDDHDTFEAIRAADVIGVFQIESRAQMQSLWRTQPKTLEDLTIQVALVRPGPIQGGAVNPYIKRRQALARDPDFEIPFLHASLEQPLAETLGTIIFQDQVISVARAFAGFTAGEAESLRRAMSRKRSQAAIDSHHQQFIDGAKRTHPDASEKVIEQVWDTTRGFAGFGFPKSHGAAFGLLAYQSTWLRVHYLPEFVCALLNEQPMGFYTPSSLIHEAKKKNVTVLPPDVNRSHAECALTHDGAIQLGLSYIKGLAEEDIATLLAARQAGAFRDLGDLAARSALSTAAALERLAWSGACHSLDDVDGRRPALWQAGLATPARTVSGGKQLTLDLPLPDTPALPALTDWEDVIAGYETTSVSVERHPVELLRENLARRGACSIADLNPLDHGSKVTVGGLVIARQRPPTAHGITFTLLEDEHGLLNVIIPAKLYQPNRLTIRREPLVIIAGRLERHPDGGGATNLLATSIERLTHTAAVAAQVQALHPPAPPLTEEEDDFLAVAPQAINFGHGRRR